MKSFIKYGWGVLEPLGESGSCQLSAEPDLWVVPFKGEVRFALGGQREAKEGVFQVQTRVPLPVWGNELNRVLG